MLKLALIVSLVGFKLECIQVSSIKIMLGLKLDIFYINVFFKKKEF